MRDILIVEDGFHERERLHRLFAALQYTVSTAESAAEAEQLLGLEQYRLVLLDIGLGDKSGSHLFDLIRRLKRPPYVIVLTGNPSISLKRRFLDQGAAAYIVKASAAAENENLLGTVRSLLGSATLSTVTGIPLADFLRAHVTAASRELFSDADGHLPPCPNCGAREYTVSFAHRTQLPPFIEGRVLCTHCNEEMDPKVG